MARATLSIKVSDLPQVKAALAKADETIGDLRHLLQQWEPRVVCSQCGQRYAERACGPTHAVVMAMVNGPSEDPR